MSCIELSDEQIFKVVEPMMDDVMLGCAKSDYQLHSKHFSLALKAQITSEVFLVSCEVQRQSWGVPGTREPLFIFRKEKSFSVIWQQNYDRTQDQVALMATVALKGGRYFVDQFSVV